MNWFRFTFRVFVWCTFDRFFVLGQGTDKTVHGTEFKLNTRRDPCFSFLLADDHNLDSKTRFLVYDIDNKSLLVYDLLSAFTSTTLLQQNSSPMLLRSAAKEPSVGFTIIKCLESEDGYQLEIGLRGVSHENDNCSTI